MKPAFATLLLGKPEGVANADGGQAISALSEPFSLTEWVFPNEGFDLPQRRF